MPLKTKVNSALIQVASTSTGRSLSCGSFVMEMNKNYLIGGGKDDLNMLIH